MGVIANKLEDLYRQHIILGEQFISGGIVDEDEYLGSKPKTVFLLKEPNEKTPEGKRRNWSMVDFLKRQTDKGTKGESLYMTWVVAGLWNYGLHHGFPGYISIKSPQNAASGIRSMGMTNLKKSGGRNAVKWVEFRDYAFKHHAVWVAELEIMNPDLVICCGKGVLWIVTSQLRLRRQATELGTGYAIWNRGTKNIVLLSAYHPAARIKQTMMYSRIAQALQKPPLASYVYGSTV